LLNGVQKRVTREYPRAKTQDAKKKKKKGESRMDNGIRTRIKITLKLTGGNSYAVIQNTHKLFFSLLFAFISVHSRFLIFGLPLILRVEKNCGLRFVVSERVPINGGLFATNGSSLMKTHKPRY